MNMENNSGKYMYTDLIISDCRGRTVVGGQVFPGNGIESFHKSSVQMIIEFYPKVHRRNNY